MSDETKLQRMNNIGNALKQLRQPYEGHFRVLGENFKPTRSRFSQGKDHRSNEHRNKKLLNGRPRYAHRNMQSGMHSGMTSPARPWFKLKTYDLDMMKIGVIREHFDKAEKEIRAVLMTSGLYNVLHTLWGDLGLYGYDAAIIEDTANGRIRGQALVPGEAWLGANGEGRIDSLYREINYTVQQVVGKFVYRGMPSNTPDWSVCSRAVKNLWEDNNLQTTVPVRHLIMPRYERDPRSGLASDKPFMSSYWEGTETKTMLGDLGYDRNPVMASRWDVEGTNVYGSSPAMDALGDAMELQRKERDKAEAVRRMLRPPMNLPTEMRNNPFSLMPEAVNYMTDPSKGAQPAYQFNPPVEALKEDILESEARIDEGMYANLFMMIANLDRRQITAREIDERHEEKLLALGPVLERQHTEKLSLIIRRAYDHVIDTGRVAPLPQEYAAVATQIEYTSTLAQAQKAVATGGIERLYGFVGNLYASDESVIDNVDNDAAVQEYADMVGVGGKIIRAENDVRDLRQERQQAAQQQAAADQAQQAVETVGAGAQAAKVLSETDAGPGGGGGAGGILRELGLSR